MFEIEIAAECTNSLKMSSIKWLVYLPEFPWQQFHTHGTTYEQAAKHGQEVIESLIEWFQEEGKPLPEPMALPEKPLKVA